MNNHITLWHHVGNFLYSNFFVGLVALGVGIAAYRVYAKQKRDAKRDAANIILLEIEDAERQLEKVSSARPFTGGDEEDVYLMKAASWDKYKYLFVRDFDRNEWDKITTFYTKCQAYDQAVVFNKASTEKNQQEVRANLQRVLTDHAAQYAKATKVDDKDVQAVSDQAYQQLHDAYIERLVGKDSNIFTYVPRQSEADAKRALSNLETSLSLTSVGIKLKAMVANKNAWKIIARLFNKLS